MIVQFDEASGSPAVAPYIEAVGGAMERLWVGTVLAGPRSRDAIEATWLPGQEGEPLERFDADVEKARKLFSEQGAEAAIGALERLVEESDGLLPGISARPDSAASMLSAHLLLWWALQQVGESGRLPSLMQATVRRFPAAEVTTRQWPPGVAEAFAVARQVMALEQTSLSFELHNAPPEGCAVFVNGFELGDGRGGSLALSRGAPIYVTARCQGALLPPRRILASGHARIELDVEMTRRLRRSDAGPSLLIPEGAGAVGPLVHTASAMGRALKAAEVVTAGVFDLQGKKILQLDRVDVAAGRRTCSVRLELDGLEGWMIDQAVHVLRVGKPTASAPVRFAGDENVYRSVVEYVDWATNDSGHPWTWVASATTAASLTTALLFAFRTDDLEGDLADCALSPSCRTSPQINDLRHDLEQAAQLRDLFAITTAISGLGAIAVFFLEGPSRSDVLAPDLPGDDAPFSLIPWMTPDSGGVTASWPLD